MAESPTLLGFRTDLALRRLGGSTVERRDGCLVIRTPDNPTFHWGNFLLLDRAPGPGSLAAWLEVFRAEHPGARHVAIGIDDPTAAPDPDEAGALGLEIERDVVLTASSLGAAAAPEGFHLETLDPALEEPWAALVDLEMGSFDGRDADAHRVFLEGRYAGHRRLAAAGHGAWCAAYLPDGTPVGTLGIFSAGEGLARYQDVMTDAAYRRRGIAGALVRYAAEYARRELDAKTLVIVAEEDGPAIGVYRRAGFQDHHPQTSLYRGSAAEGRVPQPS